jgi:hypothetical protein
MSTPSLSTVAIDVVGQYHLAGQHLARAYQTGVKRAADAMSERFAAALQSRELPLIDETVKSSLIDAQRHVAGIIADGLRAGSVAIASINDKVADSVKGSIERMAGTAARVDAALDRKDTGTINVLGMPSAQLSLSVANAVAEGAKRLGDRLVGDEAVVVEAPVVAKPVRRAARRA